MADTEITFRDLKKLAQVSRDPCGKQAFSMSGAQDAARDRNRFTEGKTYYPTVCFSGCGRDIFHLTTQRPSGRVKAMFEEKSTPRTAAGKARKKRSERGRRRRLAMRPDVCAWENEGGSYGE